MKNNLVFGIVVGVIICFSLNIVADNIISSNSVSYSNNKTAETTVNGALNELFSAVDINEKIAEIEEEMSSLKETATSVNEIYPVGSIYISTTSTNPSTLFKGTEWEQYSQGRTLVGAGTGKDSNNNSVTFENGTTGGEYEHLLNINEMPSHSHLIYVSTTNRSETATLIDAANTNSYSHEYTTSGRGTSNVGGSQYHNNIQPYITVYMWKRTA